MGFDFTNDTPIYLQIIEDIKMKIIKKEYLPNDRLPSVRELSVQYEVNPNTIQKALNELESMGLVYTERTNGKFVTSDTAMIDSVTKSSLDGMVSEFYIRIKAMGLTKQDIIDMIKEME